MIDEQELDAMLRLDPDVSIVDEPAHLVFTVDVSVAGMAGSGRINVSAATSKTCVVFTTESVSEYLGEAFQACERVANVALAVDSKGKFILRAAVLRDDSVPMAVTNTLQALAVVKITYDQLVSAKA
jgi:hypothetical protein